MDSQIHVVLLDAWQRMIFETFGLVCRTTSAVAHSEIRWIEFEI